MSSIAREKINVFDMYRIHFATRFAPGASTIPCQNDYSKHVDMLDHQNIKMVLSILKSISWLVFVLVIILVHVGT